MRDSIYTIPVSEVFEPRCGCPICRLYDTLQIRCIDYIMGAAMMEPDIRIETNEKGFCKEHFSMMLGIKNRLSLALILESHLAHIKKTGYKDFKKKGKKITVNDSCYVCDTIEWAIGNMVKTILRQYALNEDFRKLFNEQEYLCLPHLEMLLSRSGSEMPKKYLSQFEKDVTALSDKYLDVVLSDVSHFCKMFDYRNTDKNSDWGNSKDSIERAISFLASYKADE